MLDVRIITPLEIADKICEAMIYLQHSIGKDMNDSIEKQYYQITKSLVSLRMELKKLDFSE